MKKNLATILLIAMAFVNLTLSIVLVFVVVPSSMKTNNLVTKVMKILDLEMESTQPEKVLGVEDIEIYTFEQKVTANLAKSVGDSRQHYAVMSISLSLNKTNSDYTAKKELIASNETIIKEMVTDEFGKHTIDTVHDDKDEIKEVVISKLKDYFASDFIIDISFGDLVSQ